MAILDTFVSVVAPLRDDAAIVPEYIAEVMDVLRRNYSNYEPNPPQYGCDFLTTTRDCVDFLRDAAVPGLGLHLDSAILTLNREQLIPAFDLARPWIRHFHISEPPRGDRDGGRRPPRNSEEPQANRVRRLAFSRDEASRSW